MTLSLDPHPVFQGRSGPVLVVVADGVGIAPDAPHNAVTQASTPTLGCVARFRFVNAVSGPWNSCRASNR